MIFFYNALFIVSTLTFLYQVLLSSLSDSWYGLLFFFSNFLNITYDILFFFFDFWDTVRVIFFSPFFKTSNFLDPALLSFISDDFYGLLLFSLLWHFLNITYDIYFFIRFLGHRSLFFSFFFLSILLLSIQSCSHFFSIIVSNMDNYFFFFFNISFT